MKTLLVLLLISTAAIAFDDNGNSEFQSTSDPYAGETENSDFRSTADPYSDEQEKTEREQLIMEQDRENFEKREERENGGLYSDE
jgi:hypothetical protein